MANVVYMLCALASLSCAIALIRSYVRTRTRLMLWAALCFIGLTINNMLLFADFVIVPDVNLELWRSATAFVAMAILLVGLIWESES